MTTDREHVSFEQLNDYVDHRLDVESAERVSEHLDACTECRSKHAQLESLLTEASAAKVSIDPGEDLWQSVRKSIEAGKTVALPSSIGAPIAAANRPFWNRPGFLAAAAVVLIVLSSGITTVVLRSSNLPIAVVPVEPRDASLMLPANFQATAAEYDRTIQDLRVVVDAQRSKLNPETVRTIDHSLAVVDTAIAEARAALIADPNNRTLVDLLAFSYQRKLDLLRRTSELSSKI